MTSGGSFLNQSYGSAPPRQLKRTLPSSSDFDNPTLNIILSQRASPEAYCSEPARKVSKVENAKPASKSPRPVAVDPGGSGIWNLTVEDLDIMLGPYVTYADKKYVCDICSIKFNTREKALR